jgi:peptidyl-prolyl cis-trans isomerase A (cyclophilin A)
MFGANYKKSDYKEDLSTVKIKFETTKGDFVAEMYADKCPESVWNFINLAEGAKEITMMA